MDNPQRILAGRYSVGELIGRGGMAEVHIGHDARLGRTVAIKILRADLARDPSFLARFRREAQAAAALNHPAIVSVYDTGEDQHTEPDGTVAHTPFIVMEYVEGHTVRDILRDGHAVPIDEAVEITSGVLSALEYSHHAGIVHRDIKPANVMITPTGAVKVMDFGIARAVADSAATMTQTQAVVGTAQYLSPEQARGETVDARSDLYSTGCLLFELLTGRTPFSGDSPVAVVYQHVSEAPPKPSDIAPDVPEVLDRITLRALAKDRNQRYGSAAEFRGDLEAAMRGGHVGAPAIGAAVAGAAGVAAGAAFGSTAPTAAYEGATQIMSPAAGWATTAQQTPPSVLPTGSGPVSGEVQTAGEEPSRPSRKGLIWTLVTIGVLAIAAIIAIIALSGGGDADTPAQVTVPTIVGKTQDEVSKALTAVHLQLEPRVDEDSTDPQGTATKSNPEAGASVDENSTVIVYFSAGPKSAIVPDVRGKTQQQARDAFSALGLKAGDVETINDPEVPADRVIKTDPAIGDPANADTPIKLYVSSGLVTLPELTGKSLDDAKAALDKARLTGVITMQDTDNPDQVGKVIQQSPAAGSVKQGSQVTLYVGQQPDNSTQVPPNLRGMTVDAATQALYQANLNPADQVVQQSDPSAPAGVVIGSNPAPGSTVDVGTTVTLIVSSGPDQSPTPGSGQGTGDQGGDDQGGGDQGGGDQGGDTGNSSWWDRHGGKGDTTS